MVSIMGDIAVDQAKGALNIVLATAVDEIKLTCGFKGDLNKLKKRLKTLQEILVGAGTSQSLTNLQQEWLELVKKVARHVDDLFDEISFENLRRKLEIEDRYYNRGSRLKARYLFFFCLSNPLGFQWRMAHQVKDVMSMIDGVFKEAHDLGIKPTKLAATGSDGSLGSVAAAGELHQYPPSCWKGRRRSIFGEAAVRRRQHRRFFLCRHCWDCRFSFEFNVVSFYRIISHCTAKKLPGQTKNRLVWGIANYIQITVKMVSFGGILGKFYASINNDNNDNVDLQF
ncbi:hypothetical protein Dimus_006314 [Dionaea muscipula]